MKKIFLKKTLSNSLIRSIISYPFIPFLNNFSTLNNPFSKESFVRDNENLKKNTFENPPQILEALIKTLKNNYNKDFHLERDFTLLVIEEYLKNNTPELLNIFLTENNCYTKLLRFLNEIEDANKLKRIVANKIDEDSNFFYLKEINKIIDFSNLVLSADRTNKILFESRKSITEKTSSFQYDIIDLDTLESPMYFLEDAMDAVSKNAIICATFSDIFKENKGISKEFSCKDEYAIRTIYYNINSLANRHFKYIEPLLSFSNKNYIKLYFSVKKSKKECADSILKYNYIYSCTNCPHFIQHPLGRKFFTKDKQGEEIISSVPNTLKGIKIDRCQVCGGNYVINGPIWSSGINNSQFISNIMKNLTKNKFINENKLQIEQILSKILKENQIESKPLPYSFKDIKNFLKITKEIDFTNIEETIQKKGFSCCQSYNSENHYKTNINNWEIFEIMKAWKYHLKK